MKRIDPGATTVLQKALVLTAKRYTTPRILLALVIGVVSSAVSLGILAGRFSERLRDLERRVERIERLFNPEVLKDEHRDEPRQ